MGCSNPHPHGQIWTTTGLPEEAQQELAQLQKYRKDNGGTSLLADYVKVEMEKKERIVFQNRAFLVVCPWWAVWPFEVMIIAKEHKRALVDLSAEEREDFAEAIAEVTRRYDNLFETSFPYSKLCHALGDECGADYSRFWCPPSTTRRHRGGDQCFASAHALLPTSSPLCNCAQVPRRIRAHG